MLTRRIVPFAALLAALAMPMAGAEQATIAVAANFAVPAQRIAQAYEAVSTDRLTLVIGSTGKLAAQIRFGAPFDALLAADQARPQRLIDAGLAIGDSRFTYARGRLALFSAHDPRLGRDGAAALERGGVHHIAIANPELAPYGAAARDVLVSLGLWEQLSERIVRGENVAQAFAMTASGSADLGFVAWSMLPRQPGQLDGSAWLVPGDWHAPIRQDAVLLARGRSNRSARAFLEFLRGAEARTLIQEAGYALE